MDLALLHAALEQLRANTEQFDAVNERGHCMVLAGPGSGKTKTLTVAMARALAEDIAEPRGIACITYNNECALELESRLAQLAIEANERIFIGTVHSFALTQVIFPYARCCLPEFDRPDLRVATREEQRAAVEAAHSATQRGGENPHERWKFAEAKRRRDVDRGSAEWRDKDTELAMFVDAYEQTLHSQGLIDFDDMPLLALRIVSENEWVRHALRAKFPVLFVDEYQDLGHALHELVLLLCFEAGIRLFAVGDPDQSIYGFLGANPDLLLSLAAREDVRRIQLKFNYRSGNTIIAASMAALGEDREYRAPDGVADGVVDFHAVEGDLDAQAEFVFTQLLPTLQEAGLSLEKIAILYRYAKHGDAAAAAAKACGIPLVRADTNALVKRNSRLSRFIEACAAWVSGGWRDADPPFRRLVSSAVVLVFGGDATAEERTKLEAELIHFLNPQIADADFSSTSTHEWLRAFKREVLDAWRVRARNITEEWDAIDEMIRRTDSLVSHDADLPLAHFGGRVEGTGRLNFSTLHSAKGREFEAVVMFGMNSDIIPNYYERKSDNRLRGARREFYVGVTRAKRHLLLVFEKGAHSPFVAELYRRLNPA